MIVSGDKPATFKCFAVILKLIVPDCPFKIHEFDRRGALFRCNEGARAPSTRSAMLAGYLASFVYISVYSRGGGAGGQEARVPAAWLSRGRSQSACLSSTGFFYVLTDFTRENKGQTFGQRLQ